MTAKDMGEPNSSNVYGGYRFFKADFLSGQGATWARVERSQMHLTQAGFYKLVYARAHVISAANQYQALSNIRRAHVNQLIQDQ
jgi:hypothetical protein